MDQELMCSIQLKSFLIFLDLPDGTILSERKGTAIKHVVSDHSEYEMQQICIYFNSAIGFV
jgi:hypothetical protein